MSTTTTLTRCDWCDRDAGTNPILGRHGVYCSRDCEAEDAAELDGPPRSPQEIACCACPPYSSARDCPHLICGRGDEPTGTAPCACDCHREEER
jgi:hypothetical protein